jgi:N utilization substance protein A
MKGMRVQSIIRELRGEKIDIIEYSDEITTFAEKALQPAKVSRVSITDLAEKQLEVIVDDTQLSLAIGKKGQNVRLAAKLLQWKIDIKSEEEKRQEVEQQMQAMGGGPSTPIEQVVELGEAVMEKLIAAGITTVESLADMTAEELSAIPGIGEKTVEKIAVAVRHYFGHYEEGEERPVPVPAEPTLVEGEVAVAAAAASDEAGDKVHSMTHTPEEILADEAAMVGSAEEIDTLSTEDIAEAEDRLSDNDANDDNDAREAAIEMDNDTIDELVDQSQEVSDEGIDK